MKTAIYGIGNILLGDDGVGPAVVRYLTENFAFGSDVTIEDLGTPSLDLPGYLTGHDSIIFIDSVAVDDAPGTIHRFSKKDIVGAAPGIHMSSHELSINDALIVLDFAGTAPSDVTLIGIVPHTLDGGMNLSPAVAAAVPLAAEAVFTELAHRMQRGVA